MQQLTQQLTQTREQIANIDTQRDTLRERAEAIQRILDRGQQLQAAADAAKQSRIRQLADSFLGAGIAVPTDAVTSAEIEADAHAEENAAAQLAFDELQQQRADLAQQQAELHQLADGLVYQIAHARVRDLGVEYRKQAEQLFETFARARGAALALNDFADPARGRLFTAMQDPNFDQIIMPASNTIGDWIGWVGGKNCFSDARQQAEAFHAWMREL